MLVFIALAWSLSTHRKLFPWRTVLWGMALQFIFALLILKTHPGEQVFELAGRAVNRLVGFANEGSQFVFGPLANGEVLGKTFGAQNAFVFAITVTSTIILISS